MVTSSNNSVTILPFDISCAGTTQSSIRKRTAPLGKVNVLSVLPALFSGYFFPTSVLSIDKAWEVALFFEKTTIYSVTQPTIQSKKEGFFFFSQIKVQTKFFSPKISSPNFFKLYSSLSLILIKIMPSFVNSSRASINRG